MPMANGRKVSRMKPKHEYIVKMGNDADFDGNIPIASAKELVRCEDCRYWSMEETFCWFHDMLTGSKFYCAKAEKEGEQYV